MIENVQTNPVLKEKKIRKNLQKIKEKIDLKRLLFKVFDDPRPKYIAKVTVIDRVLDVLLLWAFPESVKPNHITIFRFISIPFIVFFFFKGYNAIAFILFFISALSDAIDGAIARTRNKITDWGIVFDPFADKLLIGIVGGFLIFKYLSPLLALLIIFPELVLIISAYYRFKGEIIPSKIPAKIKMVLQSLGVGFIFLFLLFNANFFLVLAVYTLYLSILFAVLSLVIYRSI